MKGLEIYKQYIGSGYRLGDVIKSPLPSLIRKPDKNPSFSTFLANGYVCWKDFGYDSPYGNGPVGFVAAMEIVDRETARDIIHQKGFSHNAQPVSYKDRIQAAKIPLGYNYSELRHEHYQYASMLCVPKKILDFYEMKALDSIESGVNRFLYKSDDDNFGFYKKIGKGNKGYIPHNPYYTNKSKVYHQGIDELECFSEIPEGVEDAVITKSVKECWISRAAGYWPFACSSENSLNILLKYRLQIEQRFPRLSIWGDPDKVGFSYGLKVKRIFPRVKILDSEKVISRDYAKDGSDITILHGNFYNIHRIMDQRFL